jgi:uncharacterized membrane protein YphA (DoxX/SURF4 family)
MNIVLWILQSLLALAFLFTGSSKLAQPKEALAQRGMAYVEDFTTTQVKLIGAAEVLAAIGLILPWATGIASVLTPIAAIGLAVIMVGAILTHRRRKESQPIPVNALLFVLAVVVAVGRFAA